MWEEEPGDGRPRFWFLLGPELEDAPAHASVGLWLISVVGVIVFGLGLWASVLAMSRRAIALGAVSRNRRDHFLVFFYLQNENEKQAKLVAAQQTLRARVGLSSNLLGANLSKRDLAGFDFAGKDFTNSDLHQARLTRATLIAR